MNLWPKPKASNKKENYNYQHRCKGRKGKRKEGKKGERVSEVVGRRRMRLFQTSKHK